MKFGINWFGGTWMAVMVESKLTIPLPFESRIVHVKLKRVYELIGVLF